MSVRNQCQKKKKVVVVVLFLMLALMMCGSVFADITDNNQGFYVMDTDCVTNSNGADGTNNGAFFVNSTHGCDFEASESDYVDISNVMQSDYQTTGWTACAWVKQETYGTPREIVGLGNGLTAGNEGDDIIQALAVNTGKFATTSYKHASGGGTGAPIVAWGTTDISSDTTNWYHVCSVFTDSLMKVYVDGVNEGSISPSPNIGNGMDTLTIGAGKFRAGLIEMFDGNIMGVGFWNDTLNTTEINQLFDGGRQFDPFFTPTFSYFTIFMSNVNTFDAEITNTTFTGDYSTTNGTIVTNLTNETASLFNITVNATGYFNSTYENYNISTDISDSMTLIEYFRIIMQNVLTFEAIMDNQNTCYEEQATGINCGAYAGTFSFTNEFNDGDYDTAVNPGISVFWYMTYIKPTAGFDSVVWQVKTSNSFSNYSIPDSCADYDINTLELRMRTKDVGGPSGRTDEFSCFDGSWVIVAEVSGGTYPRLFEEAVFWDAYQFDTTNGTIVTDIVNDLPYLYNITVDAGKTYYDNYYENYNISTNINDTMELLSYFKAIVQDYTTLGIVLKYNLTMVSTPGGDYFQYETTNGTVITNTTSRDENNWTVLIEPNVDLEYQDYTNSSYNVSVAGNLTANMTPVFYTYQFNGYHIPSEIGTVFNNFDVNSTYGVFSTTNGTLYYLNATYNSSDPNNTFYVNNTEGFFNNTFVFPVNKTVANDNVTLNFSDTIVNFTGNNVYDNTSILGFNLSVLYRTGSNEVNWTVYNWSTDNPQNLTFVHPQFYDQVIEFDANETPAQDYMYDSYQTIMKLSGENIQTTDKVPNMNYTLNDSGFITTGTNGSNNYTYFFVNASDYNVTTDAPGYAEESNEVFTIYKTETEHVFNMSFVANFTLYDEKTNLLFNISSPDSIQFVLYCEQQTFFFNVTSNNFELPITCDYSEFAFRLTYGETFYDRTLTIDPDEAFDIPVYLVDLATTSAVLVQFIVDDLYNTYDDKVVIIKATIGNATVQINGDNVDFDNSVTATLMQNQKYILEIHSSNLPVYLPGSYTASYAETKYIRIYQVGLGSAPYDEIGKVSGSYVDSLNDNIIYAIYNDTNNITSEVHIQIIESPGGAIIYDNTLGEAVFELNFNATAYNDTSLILTMDSVLKDGAQEDYSKNVYSQTKIPYNPADQVGYEFVGWIVLIILSVIALNSTSRNSTFMAFILVFITALMAAFGLLVINWVVLGVAGIVATWKLLKSGGDSK